jgi:hypothetical protein
MYHLAVEKVISKLSKLYNTNKNLGNNAILEGIACMQAKIYKKGMRKNSLNSCWTYLFLRSISTTCFGPNCTNIELLPLLH